MADDFEIAGDVARALAERRPVVALETTLVTHGLPHPDGVAAALALEAIVKGEGAVPATIGVLNGAIRVGLDRPALERLATLTCDEAQSRQPRCAARERARTARRRSRRRCSRPPGSASRCSRPAASAVCTAAPRDGRRVRRSHRARQVPGRGRVRGREGVLDLPKTVEMLETLGVPVLGFGTDEFPAFYRRSSGLSVDARFDDVAALARAVRAHLRLGSARVSSSRTRSRSSTSCRARCTSRRWPPRSPRRTGPACMAAR
jgi:pseudouridine-5'-phosphate glycosidase